MFVHRGGPMSSKITVKPNAGVGAIGLIAIIAGVIMLLVGGVAWGLVASQLAAENITVSADAKFMANKNVNDPFSAFAQATSINEHAQAMSGGKTYAELDQDDPLREVVMNASFLRASLFTSVVAFGVSAFVMLVGVLAIITGWALRRSAGGPPLVIETSDDGPVEVTGKLHARAAEKAASREEQATAELEATLHDAADYDPANRDTAFPNVSQQDVVARGVAARGAADSGSANSFSSAPKAAESSFGESQADVDKAIPQSADPDLKMNRPQRTTTGSIPMVQVPPVQPSEVAVPVNNQPEPAAPGNARDGVAPADMLKTSGADGWANPAERLPKQP